MEKTKENLGLVMKELSVFEHLLGYPKEPAQIKVVASAVMRIVGDQPECTHEVAPPSDWDLVKRGPFMRVDRAFIPWRDTFDWLIEWIADSCERFPTPIQMRKAYEAQGWKPADGKDADSLEISK